MTTTIPPMMWASTFSKYGSPDGVVEYKQVPTTHLTTPPSQPDKDDTIIVKLSASAYNPGDSHVLSGSTSMIFPIPFPDAILGMDYSGTIISIGPKATGSFTIGDKIYGTRKTPDGKGTHAEYVRISTSKDVIYKIPDTITEIQAASVGIGALTAINALCNYGGLDKIESGAKVLIVGASGGVGSWGCKIAKRLGATVTGVCSGKNKGFVEGLGVDRVVCYDEKPVKEQLNVVDEFDVILDCVGDDSYWTLAKIILKPKGKFVTVVGPVLNGEGGATLKNVMSILGAQMGRSFSSRTYSMVFDLKNGQFAKVAGWLADGSLTPPPILTTMHLKDAVLAFKSGNSHRTVGKIVLTR
ncbi:hypothetical protein HDU76_003512 [Blyttiomyces sp. JEL0837]|nr:hypothetical protein HDU76_003512 [Blyttiomyces sp. JEL0837]